MAVEQLVEAVQQCCVLPVDDLRRIARWVDDEAAPTVHQLAAESNNPALGEAVVTLGAAREAIDHAFQMIDRAISALERYTSQLIGGATSSPTSVGINEPSRRTGRATTLDEARRRLAPPLPGGRTVGAWIDKDGVEHELVSGNRDEWFTAAAQFARERGWAKGRAVLGLARHVEVKFAMRLRATWRPGQPPPNETIVIDRPPCGVLAPGDWTCDATLDDWLPPGATLTVIDRDGHRYTYRGTENP
ncbi:DddA-like double-stranded DNA deaminase toxin [Actinokineospora sp. HUAS TT18]|uniref:DddA-like double-stranded DNA deaminase toxin n=1 Tax=Actinokineospora sp. HUAS TT18 TaxID=3447451 RepID=UPI003F51D7ED